MSADQIDPTHWVDDRELSDDSGDRDHEEPDNDFVERWNANPDPEGWADETETGRIPDDAPIRDIVPDDFVARSTKNTLRSAIKEAERETSRRPEEMERCPHCLSIRLLRKVGSKKMPHENEAGDKKCVNCGEHFYEAAPSLEEARPGTQIDFREVRRR